MVPAQDVIFFPNRFFSLLHVVILFLPSPTKDIFLIKLVIILTLRLFILKNRGI